MDDADSSILRLKQPENVSFQDAVQLKCFMNHTIVPIAVT
jgi:hypothetical protein